MKITMVQKRLPFFENVCEELKKNREAYCHYKGYKFVEDTEPIRENAHWSFTFLDACLRCLEDESDDADWICHTMPAFLFINFELDLEKELYAHVQDTHYAVLPLFKMYNPDAPHYYTNLRGEPEEHMTSEPTPFVSFSCAFFKKNEWSIQFLRTIRDDPRFTRGVFKNKSIYTQVSSDALTIYYMGYPEYRKHIYTFKASEYTSLPKFGYPRHLLDLGSDMQIYSEKEKHYIVFITGCGINPTSSMDIIEKHKRYITCK